MNLPNKLTTMRMGLVVVLVALLLFPYSLAGIDVPNIFGQVNLVYFLAMIIFLVASITDFLDGHIARKHNLITNYGKFMDPIADKLLVNSILLILLKPSFDAQHAIPLVFVVLMISRDIVVDGFRLVAANQKIVMSANIFGKMKTVLQMVAIIMYLLNDYPFALIYGDSFPYVSFIFMGLATLVSVLSGIIYIVQNRQVLKEHE